MSLPAYFKVKDNIRMTGDYYISGMIFSKLPGVFYSSEKDK
ncbi:hypothetical protein BH10BAC2_BH10BAC2_12940 [soil metagenome]